MGEKCHRTEENFHLRLQRLLPDQQAMPAAAGWPQTDTNNLMLPLKTPASSNIQSDEIWKEKITS